MQTETSILRVNNDSFTGPLIIGTLEKRAPGPGCLNLDSAIHRINHYPAEQYYRNQLRYPLDSDLSRG